MGATRRFIVRLGEDATPVDLLADGRVRVGSSGDEFVVRAIAPGEYVAACGGREWRVAVAGPADARWVGCAGVSACVDVQPEGHVRRRAAQGGQGTLSAPMPGTVIDVAVVVGQQVRAGDTLLTLEAMKMEMPIRAPRDGIVSAVHCAPGELVQPGRPLVELT